jgi:hypothetical protein
VSLVVTRSLTTACALDVPRSRLCGLLLYCVFRRSRRKLLREESIPAIATLRDCDGTFRLLCKRTAARYVYAQLSCLDRFMLHRWLCRAWGCGVTALRQRPAPCVSTLRQQARLPPHDRETPPRSWPLARIWRVQLVVMIGCFEGTATPALCRPAKTHVASERNHRKQSFHG